MATFPENIACALVDGFKDILPKTTKYLAAKKEVGKANAKVTAFVKTHADMDEFTRWYITDLDWGVNVFTMSLPLFGVTRNWEVKLIKEPDIKPSSKAAYFRDIQMDLEIQDDINDYITT